MKENPYFREQELLIDFKLAGKNSPINNPFVNCLFNSSLNYPDK